MPCNSDYLKSTAEQAQRTADKLNGQTLKGARDAVVEAAREYVVAEGYGGGLKAFDKLCDAVRQYNQLENSK